jgi:hypothetical protein
MADRTELVIGAATTLLPSVIDLVKTLFVNKNPEQPPPTSAEVLLALNSAVAKSLAADDAWLAAHPKE